MEVSTQLRQPFVSTKPKTGSSYLLAGIISTVDVDVGVGGWIITREEDCESVDVAGAVGLVDCTGSEYDDGSQG